MTKTQAVDDAALIEEIARVGFSMRNASAMRADLGSVAFGAAWDEFASSWSNMPQDTYMADGGCYRRRRHAVFTATGTGIVRQPAQPHFQALDHNPLNGGIERHFAPVVAATSGNAVLTAILAYCASVFGTLAPHTKTWCVELHQFRIEAVDGRIGNPTPEGMHRDGVDFVLVMLVARTNVSSGTTHLADVRKSPLGSFTLTSPGDAVFLDDHRVLHGVTPVSAVDSNSSAYRDVLVVTFKAS